VTTISEAAPGSWTFLVDPSHPGWHNMAVDAALLELADRTGAAFVRLYQWDPFCLSFGRHESTGRFDRARIRALGIDCVRRPTGGRAVWHARELTYSVAAPLRAFTVGAKGELGGLRVAYYQIHHMLARALRTLGANPELAPRSDNPQDLRTPGPCFSARAGGEILIGGRKTVGSAQVKQGNALLQHGSVLLQDDQSMVEELDGIGREDAEPASGAPLERVLGRSVAFDEVALAIREAARASFGPVLREGQVEPAVQEIAARHAPRFRSPDWTWER